MRHRAKKHSFGRRRGHQKALMRNLVTSLVEHGRIRTTVAKAKELRRHVEKAITVGKAQSVHARRVLLSRYPNQGTVAGIVDDLSKRFMERPGGYTRIIKLGSRPGDQAEMAYIEFVDYKLPEAGTEETVKGDAGAKARVREQVRDVTRARKEARKRQSDARRVFRANA